MRHVNRLRMQYLLCVFTFIILAGCGRLGELVKEPRQLFNIMPPSGGVRTEYFEVALAGFIIKTDTQPVQVTYTLSIQVLKPQPVPLFLSVEWENPIDRSSLIKNVEIPAYAHEITVESIPIEGVKSGWDYWVKVEAYNDAEHTQKIDQFIQRFRSMIDSNLVKTQGVGALR